MSNVAQADGTGLCCALLATGYLWLSGLRGCSAVQRADCAGVPGLDRYACPDCAPFVWAIWPGYAGGQRCTGWLLGAPGRAAWVATYAARVHHGAPPMPFQVPFRPNARTNCGRQGSSAARSTYPCS
ncbi:hypothetical protein VFPFJ_10124 [Purpureocillium lilacinum]|uniref:Uncharacterized protein n=1 Tax=Purpureocillium lilacinum TaxID=33203 RepID=A0A179GJV5_PURLI|nr:hypothetical protein VFPFJ_10124 [Purpureocillium lilacinum]OAQ78092.1 hypothetical protein VFPFJ_10124 [Purpureocillium lilacinum]